MNMDEARKTRFQLSETSHLEFRDQAGKVSSAREQSIGSSENIRGEMSGSGRQPERSKVMAHVSYESGLEKNTSVPSTDNAIHTGGEEGKTHESPNKMFTKALEEKVAQGPSSAQNEVLPDDREGTKAVTESAQKGPLPDKSENMQNLREDKKHLNKKVRELKDDKIELRGEIKALEREMKLLKEEREEREARFQEAQEDALTLLKRDAIDALPDNQVRDEFKIIFTRCKQWTKKWAGSFPAQPEDIKEAIRVMLRPNENKSASVNALHAACDGTVNVRHILTAMLARHLALGLFQRPFFYLQNCKQGGRQKSTEKQLISVQEMGARNGEKMQHQWRAMTVRMIGTQTNEPAAAAPKNGHMHVQKLRNDAYATFADQVITRCESLLRNVDEEDARRRTIDLTGLFERAGDLACQLHGQHVKISVLSSHQEIGRFSVDSNIMEAHTIMDIEHDDHDWDGKPIDLVIFPGVLAYGNERGDDYDQFKVWSKAVVWMTRQQQKKIQTTPSKPSKGKSFSNSYTRVKTPVSKEVIPISDDDDEQSAKSISQGKEGNKGRGGSSHPERGDQGEKQATRTPRPSGKQGEYGRPAAPRSNSHTEAVRSQLQVVVPTNGKSSRSEEGSHTITQHTRPPSKEFQSRHGEPTKGAGTKNSKTHVEKSESAKKRNWSDDEYSESVEPRQKRRGG